MSISDQQIYIDSDKDSYDSDDSQEDPNFDVLEETRSSFSRLSIKKKNRKATEDDDTVEVEVPELDEKDKKSFETIEKLIKAGHVEKLKVEQCKVYLRKHGLRLIGNKDTLIQRIKEHLDIIDGGGERKYPASSFVLNCKGDACMGDIVMFEQNVYEMFSIASRSATGPPCGTRVVVGRIVKESYGAAKQQHTFTIEVLWSKGEKPLPPLHPLLIKGRNLYRLTTLRQRWEDEGVRHKILSEKHARGAAARSNREARVQEKEMRKMLKSNRASSTIAKQSKQDDMNNQHQPLPYHKLNPSLPSGPCQNSSVPPKAMQNAPSVFSSGHVLPQGVHQQRQPLTYASVESSRIPFQVRNDCQSNNVYPPVVKDYNVMRSPQRGTINANPSNIPTQRPVYHGNSDLNRFASSPREQHHWQKQTCRFYAQGRCYHGDNCKYLHESGENNHGQKQPCPFYAKGRCYYEDRCKYLH